MGHRIDRASFFCSLAMLIGSQVEAQLSLPAIAELEQAESSADPLARSIARAQLARARGQTALASREWVPVLEAREADVRKLEEQLRHGRLCDPAEYEFARGRLAVARAWLAEVTGREDDLRAELPSVIEHLDRAIRRNELLSERFGVVSKSEAREANRPLEEDSKWARKRKKELAPGG